MIKTWTLTNFKSVYGETTLEMAPLTLLVGANSSGKSSVIQSILLTAQTVQSRMTSEATVLNGPIVRLGAFDDIVSDGAKEAEVGIGFTLISQDEQACLSDDLSLSQNLLPRDRRRRDRYALDDITLVDCSFGFSARGGDGAEELLQLRPLLTRCRLRVHIDDKGKDRIEEIALSRPDNASEWQQELDLIPSEGEETRPSKMLLFDARAIPADARSQFFSENPSLLSFVPIGGTARRFLPDKVIGSYNLVEAQLALFLKFLRPDQKWLTDDGYGMDEIDDLVDPFAESQELNKTSVTVQDFLKRCEPHLRSLFREVVDSVEALSPPDASSPVVPALQRVETDFSIANIKNFYSSFVTPSEVAVVAEKFAEREAQITEAVCPGIVPSWKPRVQFLPMVAEDAAELIEIFFTHRIRYLGPLRDEPKPVYPLGFSGDLDDVGYRGENTAAVLHLFFNSSVDYVPSRYFGMNAPGQTLSTEKAPLNVAVSDWLEYMGVVEGIQTADRGKLGYEMRVTAPGTDFFQDLTHVGVGVSQVLPILVLSLLAEPGSTLLFEQPELHLHPRVQTRLGDFFISMISAGRQCIVETHSEYLVNRLRYRVAASPGEELANDIAIQFVEKHGKETKFRPIRVNKYGVIADWPKGFFDENEENAGAMLRAGMEKRRREGRRNDG